MIRRAAIAVSLALVSTFAGGSPAPAQAGGAIGVAIRDGTVGERFDGYMVYRPGAPTAIRAQVGQINIQRRSLYTRLASRRGVTPEIAGIAVGCQTLARVPVGGSYVLPDNVWRRRAPGQAVPRPSHCG